MPAPAQHSRRAQAPAARRWPIGAEPLPGGGVSFRLWASKPSRVEAAILDPQSREVVDRIELAAEGNGYFSGQSEAAAAGMWYGFHLDGSEKLYPDPASRFQPEGPHGASQVV